MHPSEIDALKLVSSMTLFAIVGRRGSDAASVRMAMVAERVLAFAAKQGFARCRHTEGRIGAV
jgi:hypothetical protein